MNRFKSIPLLSFVFLMVALLSSAHADVKIHTSMSSKSFYVGEEFTFEILVSGANEVKVEEADESEGIRVKFLEQITLPKKPGEKTSSTAVRYRMMPTVLGSVRIPVFSVEADATELMTNEENFIFVEKPVPYPGLELQRKLPNRDLYVGEPVTVDYQWKSPLPLAGFRAVDLKLPLFYDPSFKVRSFHKWIDGDDKAAIGLPVANTRIIGRYGHYQEAGKFFNTVSFAKILIPLKSGEFNLQPATFLGSYIEPSGVKRRVAWRTNYPSYFNNNFFESVDGEGFKKYFTSTPTQTLRVLPLPEAGKPDGFSGHVGKLSIQVTAVPKVVAAGDPITLTLVVGDLKYPEVMEFPSLDDQLAFSRQFVIPSKISRGQIEKNKKTFIFTLRPRGQDVSVIPSIRIPYFDPKSKTYGVAESAPIPITVKAAETATAFDAQVSGSGPLRNLLQGNPEGISANFTSLSSRYSGSSAKALWMLLALLLPPVGFLIFLKATSYQRLSRRDPIAARALRAMPQFKKATRKLERMSGSADPDVLISQLNDSVRAYMADRFDLVKQAHTFDELRVRIGRERRHLPDLEPLRRLYEIEEQKNFRASSTKNGQAAVALDRAEAKSLIESVKQCISTLDNS